MWEPGESARLPARPVVVMLWFMATAEEALTARLHVELPSPQARRELLGAPRRWQLGPSVQLRVPQLELRLTGSRQKAGNCSYAPSSIMNIYQHDLRHASQPHAVCSGMPSILHTALLEESRSRAGLRADH